MAEPIYRRPDDYDLEHEGDTQDIDYFVSLARRLKPKRVLELACGSGRVTVPLAEEGARSGFEVVGIELAPEMLAEAHRRRDAAPAEVQDRMDLLAGDMREWWSERPFDLVIVPCSSACHLLALDDQLAMWRASYANLLPGGRLVVDVSMPSLGVFADSLQTPPRTLVEIDRDATDEHTGERLIRYRTTRYLADEQRAEIRFLYDRYSGAPAPDRYVSDYESHVYFPRELQLLFLYTGFELEQVLGDYRGRPLGPRSEQLIVVGRRGE